MAEVNIYLNATDRASEVIGTAVEKMKSAFKSLNEIANPFSASTAEAAVVKLPPNVKPKDMETAIWGLGAGPIIGASHSAWDWILKWGPVLSFPNTLLDYWDRLKGNSEIRDLSNDIGELTTKVEQIISPLEKFHDAEQQKIGSSERLRKEIEATIEEIKFYDRYIPDLKRDFEGEPYLDLSDLYGTRKSLIDKLNELQGNPPNYDFSGLEDYIEKNFKSPVSDCITEIERLKSTLNSIDDLTEKTLHVDTTQALDAIWEIQSALASIPDITYKSVVVQYYTQSSPVRPFSEGMAYIKSQMESLPNESAHTVRYSDRGAGGGAGGIVVNLNPTVNISGAGDGTKIAREFEERLASDILMDRSPLVPAIKRRLGIR